MSTNGRIDKVVAPEGGDFKHEDMITRVKTAGSITITPELFEQMFLTPQTKVKGELRQTFGNPTPIGTSHQFAQIRNLSVANSWQLSEVSCLPPPHCLWFCLVGKAQEDWVQLMCALNNASNKNI